MHTPSTIRCLVRNSKRKKILWTKRLGLFIGIGLASMVFVLDDACMRELCPLRKKVASWKMNKPALDKYAKDERIIKFAFSTKTVQWWSKPKIQRRRPKFS